VRICFATLHEEEATPFAADFTHALHNRAARLD
jgi:hypothetical protein